MEKGWAFASLGKPNRKRTRQLLNEALTEQVEPEIRYRVRLTYLGEGEASRIVRAERTTSTGAKPSEDQPANGSSNDLPAKKPKRSTERGEGRAKLISALTKYHKYADGGCLILAPIGNNELARLAGVSESTASAFFNKQFGGHAKYRAMCTDAGTLVAALKLLNQEFAPHHLFGAKPPGEDEE